MCCQRDNDATPLAKQLGLGPTLFLMSTKAMFWLFLFLSLIYAPILAIFYTGNAAQSSSVFAKLSVGNLGAPAKTCSTNTQINKELFGNTSTSVDRAKYQAQT